MQLETDPLKPLKELLLTNTIESEHGARIIFITPVLASMILDQCNHGNRPVSPAIVGRYAKSMDGGEWFLSPDAIAIDQDWKLVNGQHRLMAVIKADMGQEFLVILNVSRRMGKVCDQGRNRNVRDLLHFQGLQVNSQVPTIMNSALMRHFGGTLDKSKCAVWYNKYSDCFEFASNLPYKKPVNYAQYKGAMACAAHYYKLPSERALLTRFAQAMAGAGDSTNKRDRLVISWRQKIIDSHSRFARLANSQSTRPLLLVKFQTILKYYMEGKSRLPDFVFQTATEKLLGKNLPEVFPLN